MVILTANYVINRQPSIWPDGRKATRPDALLLSSRGWSAVMRHSLSRNSWLAVGGTRAAKTVAGLRSTWLRVTRQRVARNSRAPYRPGGLQVRCVRRDSSSSQLLRPAGKAPRIVGFRSRGAHSVPLGGHGLRRVCASFTGQGSI